MSLELSLGSTCLLHALEQGHHWFNQTNMSLSIFLPALLHQIHVLKENPMIPFWKSFPYWTVDWGFLPLRSG